MDGGARLLDHPGLDTYLARLLHARGEVELPVLQRLLAEARAARGEVTLARALLREAALPLPRVEAALAELAREETLGIGSQTQTQPRAEPLLEVEGYQVLETLGAGGMGAVYRARHQATGTPRAIKVLTGVHDTEDVLRFRREAQGHARVDAHPNVVRVHSFGESSRGLYLVLDLVEGGSLTRYLEERAPDPLECARLVRDLCRGLEHAHAHGVLHRDLKPDNVLMAGEVPMLADFGLAKVLGEASLTVSGTILGTPAYMAPEQIDPSIAPLGPATDVYGAGAVLYYCLTGRAPFVGRSAIGVMGQVLRGELAPPRSLAPGVPHALERVCLEALSRDPTQRFASAAALGLALDEVLSGAAPSGRGGRAGLLLAVASVALLAGLLGLALAPRGAPASPSPSRAARAPEATPTPAAAAEASPALRPPLPFRHVWVPISQEPTYRRAKAKPNLASFERFLHEPLTGKVRPGPARHIAKLLLGDAETPPDRERARALLFESVLQQDERALDLLAAIHLSARLQARLARQGVVLPSVRADDELALAAAYLSTREGKSSGETSLSLYRALVGTGLEPPSSRADAYALIWDRYQAAFSERAAALASSEFAPLPLEAGDFPDSVRRILSKAEPSGLIDELYDGRGRLRCEVALALARFLAPDPYGKRRRQGLELLFETTLRGDREAAWLLCSVYAPELTAKAGATQVVPSEKQPAPPNPALAAAAALIASGAQDPALAESAKSVLEGLKAAGVTPPSDEAQAYAQLREAFFARRD